MSDRTETRYRLLDQYGDDEHPYNEYELRVVHHESAPRGWIWYLRSNKRIGADPMADRFFHTEKECLDSAENVINALSGGAMLIEKFGVVE